MQWKQKVYIYISDKEIHKQALRVNYYYSKMLALLFLHEESHFIKSEMIPKILISREVNSRDKHKRQCQIMNLCQQEKELQSK